MYGWIILGIYVIGFLISAMIFPRAFPYQEGDWEIIDGEAFPTDEETHKMLIGGMSIVWPLVLALLPLKLLTMFTDWCYDKFSKK